MANTSLRIGGGKWAVKEDNLLGYNVIQNKYVPIEIDTVRATTATRVNEQGLIEQVPYNFLVNSENFSTWNLEGGTMTSGQTDPLGGNTAYKYVQASGGLWSNGGLNSNQTKVTYSFWAKSVYGGNLNMVLADGGGYNNYGIITINGTWTYYTFTLDRTYPSSGGMYLYGISNSQGFYIWHPQINVGTSAKEYFPTTDRLNIPRIDYSSGTASLLVEPQRTNVLTYSEQFDNAVWQKANLTVTANDAISPDGTENADKFVTTSTTNENNVRYSNFSIIGNIGSSYTVSVFAKKGTADFLRIRNLFVQDGLTLGNAWFNITNGTVGTVQSSQTAKIEDMGNGWYRCSLTGVVGSSNTRNFLDIGFTNTDAINFPSTSVNGYVWGAQLEAGSNATSYVPTVASTVTRNADVISKTGISSLIGQTEGTLFVDVNYEAEGISKTYLNLGTAINSYIAIGARANNRIGMEVLNSSVQVNAQSTDIYSTSQRLKIAMTYKLNDFKLYVNGILQATDTSGTVPTKAEVYLGSYGNGTNQATDVINSAQLYKTALTDQECINLTTI